MGLLLSACSWWLYYIFLCNVCVPHRKIEVKMDLMERTYIDVNIS